MRRATSALCLLVAACHASPKAAEEPPLPGIAKPSGALASRLSAALAAKGAGYHPHTRHLEPGGRPRYTNRLILEASPYLLQHAHNPVNWYPWGDEAFEKARRERKPVLVSIGYSTCHWCHVMEAESFEDEEIARYLNENYVCIKVDREERPDLDTAYLTWVQKMGKSGGWPLNVWLTPAREPFFGGTYFPARDGDRGVRRGFVSLLRELRARFDQNPAGVAETARATADSVRVDLAGENGQDVPGAKELDGAAAFTSARFDAANGGLSGAPKFPSSLPVRLLLRRWRRTRDAAALGMATRTLEAMAAGGICDQVGGGFHRYATDEQWRVPHFEKMLYDNALLATAYVEAFEATRRPDLARVARDTLGYLQRDMGSPEGAFYSATDADSQGGEGAYFTWTKAELDAALGEGAARFEQYFGVTAAGNFGGKNILFVPHPDEMERTALEPSLTRVLEARSHRAAPERDEKILTAWNGLAISAFAQAGRALAEARWTEAAQRSAGFAISHLAVQGAVRRGWARGAPLGPGFLEDAAFLIQGLVDLFEADGDARWLEAALSVQADLDTRFADPRGGFFRTAAGVPQPLGRERPAEDGPEPSGNSVEALNLLRLAELTEKDAFRQEAEMTMRGLGPGVVERPAAFPDLLLAVDFWTDRPREIAIVQPDADAPDDGLAALVRQSFLPNDVAWIGTESEAARAARTLPWLEGKRAAKGRATAYVCTQGVCGLPTSSAAALRSNLSP